MLGAFKGVTVVLYVQKYDVDLWLRTDNCHLTFSIFFIFPVISGADEIGLHRHLESSDTEDEYHEENDIQRPSFRERAIAPMHHWGRGKVYFKKGHMVKKTNMQLLELPVF